MPLPKVCVVCRNILAEENEEGLQEDTQYKFQEEFLENIHICVGCARKDKVQKKIKEYTPFMEQFSKMVNNCAFDHDGVITDALVTCFFQQHRYLQNEMILGLKKIFAKIGKQSGNAMYEDARNVWALKWCQAVGNVDYIE